MLDLDEEKRTVLENVRVYKSEAFLAVEVHAVQNSA